jgi:hypothetical protein
MILSSSPTNFVPQLLHRYQADSYRFADSCPGATGRL